MRSAQNAEALLVQIHRATLTPVEDVYQNRLWFKVFEHTREPARAQTRGDHDDGTRVIPRPARAASIAASAVFKSNRDGGL